MTSRLNSSIAAATLLMCVCASASAQVAVAPDAGNAPAVKSMPNVEIGEKKFYLKAYGFYNLLSLGGFRGLGAPPTSTSTRRTTTNNVTTSSTTTRSSSEYQNENPFGSGLRVGAGIGYVSSSFINLGLDVEYQRDNGTSESYFTTSETVSRQGNTQTITIPNTADVRSDYTYRLLSIIPNVTFKAVSKPQYYVYNRLGLIIGVPTQLAYTTIELYKYPQSGNASDFYQLTTTNEFKKHVGFGYQAALGVQFKLTSALRGFAELVASNLQLKTDSYSITKYTYEYKFGNNPVETEELDPSELSEDTRERTGLDLAIPINAIGVSAGLMYRF